MAAPFGFSVGDFLAAIELTIEIVQALRPSNRASAECVTAIAFLDSVQYTLQRAKTVGLESLYGSNAAEEIKHLQLCAQSCCEEIVRFSKRLQKHDAKLGSGSTLRQRLRRDIAKVRWGVSMKDDMATLKAAVTPHLTSVQLALQLMEVPRRVQERQVQEAILVATRSTQGQVRQLVSLVEKDALADAERELDAVTKPLAFPGRSRARLLGKPGSRRDGLRQVQAEIKAQAFIAGSALEELLVLCMLCLWELVRECCTRLHCISYGPSWLLDTNITLTDGLGRRLSLPYEHFRSYDVLRARLIYAFKDCAGSFHVQQDYYQIYRPADGCVIQAEEWEAVVRAGDRLAMAMLIRSTHAQTFRCRSCREGWAEQSAVGGQSHSICADCGRYRGYFQIREPVDAIDAKFDGSSDAEDDGKDSFIAASEPGSSENGSISSPATEATDAELNTEADDRGFMDIEDWPDEPMVHLPAEWDLCYAALHDCVDAFKIVKRILWRCKDCDISFEFEDDYEQHMGDQHFHCDGACAIES